MSNEDLTTRKYIATEPFDANDPPKFSQLVETAKDAFASELTSFFSYKTTDASSKISEMPNIQKFELGASGREDSLETVVNLIMAYGDTLDKFPMISITSMNLRERNMHLGDNFVANVQYPPSIVSSLAGPYDLDHGSGDAWYLDIQTYPDGSTSSETTSRITFQRTMFADPTSVTAEELSARINMIQALYYTCAETHDGKFRISTGGPCAVAVPNTIEVTAGSSEILLRLGFVVGDSDTYLNTDNPPKNRYGIAGDLSINVDVVSDDLNTRTELADLVSNYFTFYMEKRRFQLLGRSYFDRSLSPEEWFHICFKNQFSWSSEIVKPRQGGEQYSQIFAIRGTVPIFIEDFIDRKLVTAPVFLDRDSISYDEDIPDGDYPGTNYLKL